MDTLPVFSARQTYLSSCSDASCRRAAPLICRRVWNPSKYTEMKDFPMKAIVLICSCQHTASLNRFQPFLHALHRSTCRVSAIDPASLPSSDAVEVEREEGMPIPGTITFRRSATERHYEYFTDLETLGMGSFSTKLSRNVALSMGISEAPNSEPTSTPASVSIDVTREGRDLRLDGIVRTSLALNCNRCGVPVAERVFGEFSLLLTEQPVVEPTKQRVGVVLSGGGAMPDEEEDIEDILDLDLDDKLHFPKTEKTIDISKYIRDTVHLEIPMQCICGLSCKGRCFECGINFNKSSCTCAMKAKNEDRRSRWGPLERLKEQLDSEGRS